MTDKRKATSCKSKSVMESATQCGHFGVIILQLGSNTNDYNFTGLQRNVIPLECLNVHH